MDVAGVESRLCWRLKVPMSSEQMTVGGFLSCFVRLATTAADVLARKHFLVSYVVQSLLYG